MNKNDKRHNNIRNKLFAAIAMLLVSSIMMVSTTYAWFTLSTAPEVQGITTTVGANGNLEIALMPYNGDATLVSTSTSDSTIPDNYIKNMTWGNLLDLNDADYALDTIKLLPSRLNIIGEAVDAAPLKTPAYGADGRISALNANTTIGARPVTVDPTNLVNPFTFGNGWEVRTNAGGVRAIGSSASLTEYEQLFNYNLAKMASYMGSSQDAAEASLTNNGATLADMAMVHMNDTAEAKTYETYLPALRDVVNELQSANNNLKKAILAGLVAAGASSKSSEEAYLIAKGIDPETANLTTVWTDLTAKVDVATHVPQLKSAYDTWVATEAKLSDSASKLDTLEKTTDPIKWANASPVLNNLMNTTGITINGKDMDEFKKLVSWGTQIETKPDGCTEAEWEEAKTFVSGCAKSITLELGKTSGVYGELAEAVGDIDATVVLPKLVYGDMGLTNVDAIIKTKAEPQAGAFLKQVRMGLATVGAYSPSGATTTQTRVLDATYGYIVDFLFRTNATNSQLKLRTEAANRVYEDGSEATMGHGSTMTFRTSEVLNVVAVRGLMEAIRVVFMDYETQTIYGIAKLDMATATQTEITAATEDTPAVVDVTAKLYLYDYENAVVDPITGKTTMNTKLDDASLCDLQVNTAVAVSALVYIDGDYVGNEDVANAETSVTGTMNLQFESSADLVPMENSALENMTVSTEATATPTP